MYVYIYIRKTYTETYETTNKKTDATITAAKTIYSLRK